MCRNTSEYRKLSLEDKMEVLFKKLKIELLENKLIIAGLYIVDDNRYIYHVFNNLKEEFYIVNKNELVNMKIEQKTTDSEKLTSEYICDIGKSRTIDFKLYLDAYDEEKNRLMISDKDIYNKYDSYLYNMFHDIYRMNTSV